MSQYLKVQASLFVVESTIDSMILRCTSFVFHEATAQAFVRVFYPLHFTITLWARLLVLFHLLLDRRLSHPDPPSFLPTPHQARSP